MSGEQIGMVIMLLAGGIFSGVMVAVAVERVNLWRRQPVDQYAVDFRRSLYRLDPMQPILGAITGVGAIVFALSASGRPSVFAWIALVLLVVVIVASVLIAEPMNSKFRRLPEGEVPPHAAAIRVRWRRFHFARTAVTVAALVALVLAASHV